ncbi:pyridoxamine 5'-phosphate oxidase [Pontibacter sp. JH31]|uniref:Pyridoxine/pyridoxamine 5'-phosphate oxidase n=1 Tax=Pontibacter aquaedesilientis TaxID=2766980 RepID=A0ABR7XCV2_9BACT|nr:pyridoxamine 5'-phosphate oxidase [Pontibacter aquaedesilientis]MBD1396124.1 pyridoxamine 5'-phosphate oxidase [Pontibacter aquaedesilientis]
MSLQHDIASIRINYSRQALTEDSVSLDPLDQFKVWLNEAIVAQVLEPTALVLSTVSADCRPSARVVLLKEVSADGFVFFTNYESRKGQELAQRPYGSLTFFWAELERQVRIEGSINKVADEVSDTYFHSRPRGSQVGAWASPQSKVIDSREELELADQKYQNDFASLQVVPRPQHWGGYVLKAERIEFWQGRPNRLHDRILFELEGGNWSRKRLAP